MSADPMKSSMMTLYTMIMGCMMRVVPDINFSMMINN